MSMPPPGNYPEQSDGDSAPTSSTKGFFGALFDLSFEHYATSVIIKVVYVITMIALGSPGSVGWPSDSTKAPL